MPDFNRIMRIVEDLDPRIGLVVFSVLLAVFMLAYPVWTEKAQYDLTAYVDPDVEELSVGLSVDADRLDFGRLPARTVQAEKTVTLTNNEETEARLRVQAAGNISTYLVLSHDEFVLPPGGSQDLDVTLRTTDVIEAGRYQGDLTVLIRRPVYQVVLNAVR